MCGTEVQRATKIKRESCVCELGFYSSISEWARTISGRADMEETCRNSRNRQKQREQAETTGTGRNNGNR